VLQTPEPIKINQPEIFQKLRNRFGVRTGVGRNAELAMSIQPVVDVNPLLLRTRGFTFTVVPSSATTWLALTCPATAFYHLKRVWYADLALSDYTYKVQMRAQTLDIPTTTRDISLTNSVVAAGAAENGALDVVGLTMRPGDSLLLDVSAHTAGGSGTLIEVLLDEEDCSS